jgi:hypothetical protein
VVFSPFTPIAANNVRDPNSPFALGDEIVFHDQLFAGGKRVGDDLGSCVIASITSQELAANCSLVIRLPDGNLTGQFIAVQGPAPREIALTGGTGRYRSAGGEGTLVEFGQRQRTHDSAAAEPSGPRQGRLSGGRPSSGPPAARAPARRGGRP